VACLAAIGCGVADSEPASLEAEDEDVSEAALAPRAEPPALIGTLEEGEAAPMPAEPPSGGFARQGAIGAAPRDDGWGAGAARMPARAQERIERARRPVATATPARPASPAARIAPPPPGLPQNAVLSSTFVGGSGASARLEDLLDRGVMVGGENVRLEAFDELGRLPYPVPAEEAVGLHAELERSRIHTDGERVHLQIALMARQGEAPPRPRMDVRLVLDRSGSMNGEKWEHAIAAAHQIIDRLEPSDTFGLVSYSNEASLDLSPARVGDRRAAHAAVRGLVPGGGTNIEAALRLAAAHSPRRRAMNDVLLVVLVSDGVANIGQTNAEALGQLARETFEAHGALTTSVGLGTDFDEDTMLAIAREGSGSYHFVRRASDIGTILTDELEERAQSVAQALRLRIELAEGVVATRVYGSRVLEQQEEARVRATEIATDQRLARELGISRDRQRDEDRGLRIHLPSFRRGDQHVVLMELEVPAGTRAATLANITLDYKDLLSRGNRTARVEVRGERTRDREAAVASTARTVKRTVLAFAAGDALSAAARALEQGDVQAARQQIAERQRVLVAAADLWNDRALARDAQLLGRYDRVLQSAWPSWDDGSRRTMVMAMNFYGAERMQ
jgi:Ca-activated chloride channel family protein